jgi:predicted Zn-dependent peptidase
MKNGMKVASQEMDVPTATVGVWIDTGSRFETDKNNGVSNFLDHLIFKGTKQRSQAVLEKEIESMGAQLNSKTGRESTSVYIKCLAGDVDKAVAVLSDVLQNSVFDEDEIDRQREVILGEMDELDTNLKKVTMNYLHATAYQGTALGRSVVGTTNNVKSMTKQQLVDFYSNQYKAPRMVLSCAGGVPHDYLVGVAEKHFSGVSAAYEAEIPVRKEIRFTGSEIRARDDDIPLCHVAIAVQGPGWEHADTIPLNVGRTVIGSFDRSHGGGVNLSSALAAGSSAEAKVHMFKSFFKTYADTSLWGTYFVVDRMMIDDFLRVLQGEWMKLCSSVTDFEVDRAKNQLKTQMWGKLNGTTAIAEDIARQYTMFGRRIPLTEYEARINAVDAQVVRDVCYKYIYDTCPAVAGVGPVEQLPDYNRTRAGMYWLRF